MAAVVVAAEAEAEAEAPGEGPELRDHRMTPMTEAEVRAFMIAGSRTGKLATVRADGRPHVASIWFDFDPETGDAVFMTWHTSVKARNMRGDPRVSILVDDEEMPFAWARLDGIASFSEEDRVHWATFTCRRYVGEERAAEFGARNGVDGELVVRVTPTAITGRSNISG